MASWWWCYLSTLAPDGTAAAPSYSFSSEANTGLFLSSAGNLSAVASGITSCNFTSTQINPPTTNSRGLGTSNLHWANMWIRAVNVTDSSWAKGRWVVGGNTPSGSSADTRVIGGDTSTANSLAIMSDNVSNTSGRLWIESGNSTGTNALATGEIIFKTGDKTNAAATGNTGKISILTGNAAAAGGSSGEIEIRSGTAPAGTRGRIVTDARCFRLPLHASAPTATEGGDMYYDTTTNKSYTWDGSAWQAHW